MLDLGHSINKARIQMIRTLLGLCLGLAITCILSLIMAEIGVFSWQATTSIFILSFFFARVLFKRLYFPQIDTPSITYKETCLLIILLIAGYFLYWPPSEYILGGWDPGVYLASGACISKHHSINFLDQLLKSLNAQDRSIFVSTGFGFSEFFPGMRLMNPPDGSMIGPQFFHLYPTLLAWAFGLMGMKGSLAINPLIGILSVLTIYALCRISTGPLIALLGALFLFVNPVQVWMARFQNSEILTQLGFLLGFLFLFWAHPPSTHHELYKNKRWMFTAHILSALCFCISLLARYDFLLVVVPLFTLGLCSLAWKTTPLITRQARFLWLILLSTGIVHTFIHQKIVAYRYYPLSHIFEPAVVILIGVSIALTLGIYFLFGTINKIWERWNKPIRWIGAVGILLATTYAAFMRPHDLALGWERFNFLNLNSFVTEMVMVLAIIGILTTILHTKRFDEGALIVSGLLVTAIVVRNKFIDPFYLWGARRFIPVVFPFLFVMAALGVRQILELTDVFLKYRKLHLIRRWLPTTLVVGFTLTYVFITQPNRKELQGYRDFSGLTRFFEEMSKRIPKADLIITQERGVAEILHFYYDLPGVYLRNTESSQLKLLQRILINRIKKNQRVFILTQNKDVYDDLAKLKLNPLEKFTWRGKRLNDSRYGFPRGTKDRGFDLLLLEVSLKR